MKKCFLILLMINNLVMAQEFTTVKINELATKSLSASDYFIKGEGSLMYKNTLGALADFIGAVGVLGYKGALAIADIPTEDGFYFASESGTYTNAGSLVVDSSAGLNIISVTGGQTVFDLVVVPVDLTQINENLSDISELVDKNLFDESKIVTDRYLNNDGLIQVAAGWARSGNIPVTPGQTYTLSGQRARSGLAFYQDSSGVPIEGSYTAADNPVTVVAPPGAVYCIFNIYTAADTSYSNLQFEEGNQSTFYVPHGGKYFVKTDAIPQNETLTDSLKLNIDFTGASNTVIDSYSELGHFKQEVVPFRPLSINDAQSFDFRRTYFNDVLIHNMPDECAPYRVTGFTVGANHGYARNRITSASHGKTNVDVGSIWSDGISEYVITAIPDANTIDVTARLGNGYLNAANTSLIHVSGATNTANINSSSKVNEDFFPAYKDRVMSVYIDDVNIKSSGNYTATDKIVFKESYNIMDKDSMIEWLIAQAGTSTEIIQMQGDAVLRANITYEFDKYGVCTIYTDLIALNDISQLQDIMFNMNNRLEAPYDLYIPKALPFVHEGNSLDLSQPTDVSGFSWSTRVDMTPARCEPSGILSDRAVMLKSNVGYALGYLPIRDAGVAERRTNATRKALQISNTNKKIYMSAIDSEGISSMAKGDSFSVVAYKAYFPKVSGTTASYFVNSKYGVYMYADWHTTGVKTIQVPSKYIGADFEIVEKSSNVTLLGNDNNGSVTVDIDSTIDYGYLMLKLLK